MCCICGGGNTAGGDDGSDEGDNIEDDEGDNEGGDEDNEEGEDDAADAGGIGECRNTNILDGEILSDRFGDACDEYTASNAESWCGSYDEGAFDSNSMCCACGGGSTAGDEGSDEGDNEGSDEGEDEGADEGEEEGEDDAVDAGGIGECRNTNILDGEILSDRYGDACDAYTASNADSWCGVYDEGAFDSNSMCCACGGGNTG